MKAQVKKNDRSNRLPIEDRNIRKSAPSAFQPVDNRHESVAQRQLQEISDNSHRIAQLHSIIQSTAVIQRNDNVAKDPSIESIKDAFPILGARLETAYAKIDHSLTADSSLKSLMKTFKARLDVMKYFRQALLANGINGASSSHQQKFKSGVEGHIQALVQLRTLILTNNPDDDPGDENEIRSILAGVTIKKQQIK